MLTKFTRHFNRLKLRLQTDAIHYIYIIRLHATRQLRISFSRSRRTVDHFTINDKQIEVVSSAKLLGVVVSDNLRWNAHVEAATRLYCDVPVLLNTAKAR